MKILCQQSNGFYQDEMSAWSKILVYNNNDFTFFDIQKKPVFDAFYEIKPDLFIVNANECTKKLDYLAEKYHSCKIVLLNVEGNFKNYKQNNIYTFSYLNDDIRPCFDLFIFKESEAKKEYLSEVNYIAREFNKDYLKFMNNFDIKIFGKGHWPTPRFLGNIEDSEKKHVIASCQYSLCGSSYKDIKWFLECVACNKYCFAYKNEYIKNMLSKEFYVDNYKEIFDLIFINQQQNQISNFNLLRDKIIKEYSSKNQIANILKKIGLNEEAEKCLKI